MLFLIEPSCAFHCSNPDRFDGQVDEDSKKLGNFLDGKLPSKNQGTYQHRTGFCLETQHYPDTPNQKDFPSVRLNPGESYQSQTVFRFSVY